MAYDEAHRSFIQYHIDNRKGERRGRLERGHGHAEALFLRNVWWPLRGDFQHLHPEYEVIDWRGRSYFADFAWLPGMVKLIFEIKGFASHVRDMDRQKYCNELNRETFLFAMGYRVISFAYDDVENHPELCITLLTYGDEQISVRTVADIPCTACRERNYTASDSASQPIRPKDVERHLEIRSQNGDYFAAKAVRKRLAAALLQRQSGADRPI